MRKFGPIKQKMLLISRGGALLKKERRVVEVS